MSLKFSEKAHRYTLDGRPVPGVTTLLGKGLPKPAIPYWAAKTIAEYVADNEAAVEQLRLIGRGPMVAALKGIPWEKRDEAAVRGTAVHAIAEQVIHGTDVEVPDHLADHVEGYVRFLDEFDVQPLHVERRVLSRAHWYAGTLDAIVRIGDETWLIDLKTSRGVYGSMSGQLAAYANAEAYIDDDGNEQPLPHIDALGVVHVTATGSTLHRVKDPEHAWKCFRHIRWVAEQIPTLDASLGDAELPPATSATTEEPAA